MARNNKIRNLINSKSRKVSKENVSWEHLKLLTLELLPHLEEIEETNNINKIKKVKKFVQKYVTVVKYMEGRLQHEIDNLEYLKQHNKEKQKRLTESQLRALYTKHAINDLEKNGIPYTEENLKIKLDHMIEAYIEREGEREGHDKEVKQEIKRRIEDFNPEGLDFDIEKPM